MNRLMTRQQTCVSTALILLLLIGCGKPSPDELLQEGGELMAQQNFVSARHKFQEIVENYPDYDLISNAKFYIGDCYALDGQIGKARTTYEELAEAYTGTPIGHRAQVRLGDMAREDGRIQDAVKHYSNIIESSTDTGLVMQTRTNLADAYVRSGSSAEAVGSMREMVDASGDPRSKLQAIQYLANYLISQGSKEVAWEAMLSIKDATEIVPAMDYYFLSVRQTGIATNHFDEASQYFDSVVEAATDDESKSRALYNKALIASSTTVSRATGIELLKAVAADYPKTRWGRWSEVDAAKTIMTASEEFENPIATVGDLLLGAMDNYDDIIEDSTIEWFEPARSADARFQLAVIQVMRGQWLESVEDLKSASATYAEILNRFETMPQIAQQASQYLNEMTAMVEIAEASGEEFWEQLRMIRRGIDPFAQSATAEATLNGTTEELAAPVDLATAELKN